MIGETDHSTYKPALTYHPLANLFPMIEGPERLAFRQSIRDKGLRVRIVMHEGMILDGRNRYRELLGLQLIDHSTDWTTSPYFRVFGSEETDGDDPLSFVLDLNLDRRHLNESQRASVAARMATMKRGERTDLKEGSSLGEGLEKTSRAEAAERLNVSERSVNSAKAVQDKGAPELVEAVDQGVLPVSVAEKLLTLPVEEQTRLVTEETPAVIRNAAKKAQRSDKEQKLAAKQKALPQKRYGVIYVDPAWRFEPRSRETGLDRSADNHYPTMATEDIVALPVGDIAAPDCAMFMWATVPLLPDALKVMSAWGFGYKSHYIWDKTPWDGDGADNAIAGRQGTGFWGRVNHELLLIGTRGNPTCPAPGDNFPTVYREVAGDHSAKPEHYARMIESYFPNLPKIELNARAPREGWEVWGNESEGKASEQDKPVTAIAQPLNTYIADLNSVSLDQLKFRATPPGEPGVAELVAPGTVVRTSYGSGPYIVVSIAGPYHYAPDRADGIRHLSVEDAQSVNDRLFQHHSLRLTHVREFEEKPKKATLKGDSMINEVVAVGGRLLKLFLANDDETFIEGFNPDAAKLLGAPELAPKEFAQLVQVDPQPGWPNIISDAAKTFVTPAELLEFKVLKAIAGGKQISGPVVDRALKDGDLYRDNDRIDLTQRGWGTADLLQDVLNRATYDGAVNVVDNGISEGVSDAHIEENSESSAYIVELGKVVHLKGQLHQSTAEPAMRAAYGANPPVPVVQLAEDLGHPLGTIKTWANRLKLTSRDRMLASRAPAFSTENQPARPEAAE